MQVGTQKSQEQDQQPQASAQAAQEARMPGRSAAREPQVIVEAKRYNPGKEIPADIDPAKNPEAWAEKIIRDGNAATYQQRGVGHERYSDFYLVFKDKANPDTVLAAVPIEHASSPSDSTIPTAITGVPSMRITGVSFLQPNESGGVSPARSGSKAVTWDTPARDKIYGDKAEGGSKNAIAVSLEVDHPTISRAHAILTFDRDGYPSRFIVPRYTQGNNTQYQPYGTASRQANLRPGVSTDDMPSVETKRQAWAPKADIDHENVETEGEVTKYPITFSLEEQTEGRGATSTAHSGTLVIEEGNARVEPAEDAKLQQAFASMHVRRDPNGQVQVERWSEPEFGLAEEGAQVSVGDKTYENQRVLPIRFRGPDGENERQAMLYVDAEEKVHILSQEQVTLLRPSIEGITAVQGQENQYSATMQHRVITAEGEVEKKAVPLRITVPEDGSVQFSYDAEQGEKINTGENGSLTQEEAQRVLSHSLQRGDFGVVPRENDAPKVLQMLPKAAEASEQTRDEVAQLLEKFEPRVDNGNIQLDTRKVSARQFTDTLLIETGAEQVKEISITEMLPVGVSLAAPPKVAERSGTFQGNRVLPFRFETTTPVGDPPSTEHTGFLRISQDGLSLRQAGSGTAIRMESELRISGIRLLASENEKAHTDRGFIPIEK